MMIHPAKPYQAKAEAYDIRARLARKAASDAKLGSLGQRIATGLAEKYERLAEEHRKKEGNGEQGRVPLES
jgi:hypothetical protein